MKRFEEIHRIGNRAVAKAIAENKRLGIPNYWSVDGKIIAHDMTEPVTQDSEIWLMRRMRGG